jgi:hypothetical protein
MQFIQQHFWELAFALVFAIIIPYVGFLLDLFSHEKWVGNFSEKGITLRENITVFRKFGVVRGISELSYTENSEERTAKYRIRGSEKHGIICAYYEGGDDGNSERGTFILKMSINKSQYVGIYLLFVEDDKIEQVEYRWTKKSR